MQNLGLILEFESILTKQRTDFSSTYIKKDAKNEDVVGLLRYVFQDFLNWSADEMILYTTPKLIEELHLERVLKKISYPPELDRTKDLFYLASIVYPDQVHISRQEMVLNIYQKVLDGELHKFPKNFFMTVRQKNNVYICLRYAISHYLVVHSIEELYDYFTNTRLAAAFLKKVKLWSVCNDYFTSPVQMLHEALPEDQRSGLYYLHAVWLMEMKRKKHLKYSSEAKRNEVDLIDHNIKRSKRKKVRSENESGRSKTG